MGNELQVHIPDPMAVIVDRAIQTTMAKNLEEIRDATNTAIERGVATDVTAREAESIVRDGRTAMKVIKETRKLFTRPLDEVKRELMDAEQQLLDVIAAANAKLDGMVMDRAVRIRQEKERIAREAEEARRKAEAEAAEANRKAEEEARKKEERNRKISLSKGGDGNVAPVIPEKVIPEVVAPPVTTVGMRETTRTSKRPNKEAIQRAIDAGARSIDGCEIWCEWKFKVVDSKKLPDDYVKFVRG